MVDVRHGRRVFIMGQEWLWLIPLMDGVCEFLTRMRAVGDFGNADKVRAFFKNRGLEIRYGAKFIEWEPALDYAAKLTVERKPNVPE